jgi:hypothetical protein
MANLYWNNSEIFHQSFTMVRPQREASPMDRTCSYGFSHFGPFHLKSNNLKHLLSEIIRTAYIHVNGIDIWLDGNTGKYAWGRLMKQYEGHVSSVLFLHKSFETLNQQTSYESTFKQKVDCLNNLKKCFNLYLINRDTVKVRWSP